MDYGRRTARARRNALTTNAPWRSVLDNGVVTFLGGKGNREERDVVSARSILRVILLRPRDLVRFARRRDSTIYWVPVQLSVVW